MMIKKTEYPRRSADLSGQKFSRLTVISYDHTMIRTSSGGFVVSRAIWKCLCDCGNIAFVMTGKLKSGHKKSCGCLNSESSRERMNKMLHRYKNLCGLKFGLLTVTRLDHVKPTSRGNRVLRYWECICDCGEKRLVNSGALTSGQRTRCVKCALNRRRLPPCEGGIVIKTRGENNGQWRGCGVIPQNYWSGLRNGARYRGLELSITIEQANELFQQQKGLCAYTGRSLHFIGTEYRDRTASLDRKDSKIGYVSGNVHWVHKEINQMKWSATHEHFIESCREVVNNMSNYEKLL